MHAHLEHTHRTVREFAWTSLDKLELWTLDLDLDLDKASFQN